MCSFTCQHLENFLSHGWANLLFCLYPGSRSHPCMKSVLFSDDSFLVMGFQKFKFWCFPALLWLYKKSIFELVSCKALELQIIINFAVYNNQKMYIHFSAHLLYPLWPILFIENLYIICKYSYSYVCTMEFPPLDHKKQRKQILAVTSNCSELITPSHIQ